MIAVDDLIEIVRASFETVTDSRDSNQSYRLCTLLSLSFAMSHLKDASLSAFREDFSVRAENLRQVYGVELYLKTLPCVLRWTK